MWFVNKNIVTEAYWVLSMQDRQHCVNYDLSVELQTFLLTSLPFIFQNWLNEMVNQFDS